MRRRRHDKCLSGPIMDDGGSGTGASFDWRVQTGPWRWLILGALGTTPLGCGGRSSSIDPTASGAGSERDGTSSTTVPTRGSPTTGTVSPSNGTAPVPAGTPAPAGRSGPGAPTSTASACEPPLTDLGAGWERCGNGMVHRPSLGICPSSVPRPKPLVPSIGDPYEDADAGLSGTCRYDSDCTERPYGHCEWAPDIGIKICEYGCVANSDCSPGYACVCGDPVGACLIASCAVDAECGPGFLCIDYEYDVGCGGRGFSCQTSEDSCSAASDCSEGLRCARGYSPVQPDVPRSCTPALCVVGRPFLIAGRVRLAADVVRSDWYPAARAEPPEAALEIDRRAIQRGWLDQALMEHASVAAFARFSLQLLALGAPAELLAGAAQAMNDEIEHARACFDLARRHSESDIGPGPLALDGALESTDLAAVMLGTILEGCIGETVAAIEAAEACAHSEDPTVRALLERIARDETRHAQLAWRFVSWALDAGPPALREQARAAFAEATVPAPPPASAPTARDRELARHGLIAAPLRAELRRRVLRDVIAPCASALLAGAEGDTHRSSRAGAPAASASRLGERPQ